MLYKLGMNKTDEVPGLIEESARKKKKDNAISNITAKMLPVSSYKEKNTKILVTKDIDYLT